MRTLPPQYLDALTPVFLAAKQNLETDGRVVPFAFLGSLSSRSVFPVQISTESPEAKERSAEHLRKLAAMEAADFVALVMESYTLPKNRVHLHEDYVRKYGSLSRTPAAQEVVSISVESLTTIWMATCVIRPLRHSKKRRTFEVPSAGDFVGVTEAGGTFVKILPGSKIIDPTEE